MCDISKSNYLSKMIYYGNYFIVVMIFMTKCVAKLSFWALKLFLVHIAKVLFKFVHSVVFKESEMKNIGNEMPNIDSDDDSAWEYAEEESLDDFHDSHQYVRWELPPEALEFYPMASLFALHGVPYKWPSSPPTYYNDLPLPTGFLSFPSEFIQEPMTKIRKPKRSWKKRLLHGLKRKRVPTPTTDDSDTSYEPTEEEDTENRESKEPGISSDWVAIPLKDDFQPTEQLVNECRESKETCDQPCCLNVISSEWVDIPLRDDSITSFEFEPTEQEVTEYGESKEVREQPLLDEITSECVDAPLTNDVNISTDQPVIECPKPKKTWKQRLCCCISKQSDD